MVTNMQFAQGLRELADIYDKHPEMLQPYGSEIRLYLTANREAFAGSIRALADGGKVDKPEKIREDAYFYEVKRTLPSGVVVRMSSDRSSVCRRVRKMQMVDTWECPDSILAEAENG